MPLGYCSLGKKLEIASEDAALVRKIFEDYLRLGLMGELAAALEQKDVRPRPRVSYNGTAVAAKRFIDRRCPAGLIRAPRAHHGDEWLVILHPPRRPRIITPWPESTDRLARLM